MNPAWNSSYGVFAELNISGALVADTTASMRSMINQIPGSIGYLGYGSTSNQDAFTLASIENMHGEYIKPSLDSISLAATMDIPKDTRVSCIYTNTHNAYPLTSFSWLITYKNQKNNFKKRKDSKNFKMFLTWLITEAQENASSINHAPLPKNVQKTSLQIIKSIKHL